MAENQRTLRLVVSNKEPLVRKKRAYWWRNMHPCRAIQIPVAVITLVIFVSGMFFNAFEYWRASSNLFAVSAIGAFVLWFLEHQILEDYDLMKTED